MKNKKLNLNELRVKSFVTEFENEKENTVKGGQPSLGILMGCPFTGGCQIQRTHNDDSMCICL